MLSNFLNKWDNSVDFREVELWAEIESSFEGILELRSFIRKAKMNLNNDTAENSTSDSLANRIKRSTAKKLLDFADSTLYGMHWCMYLWHLNVAPTHRLHMLEKSMVTALM